MQETRQKSLKQLLRLMCEFPLFIFLFIYLVAMISMLKKTRGKKKHLNKTQKRRDEGAGHTTKRGFKLSVPLRKVHKY